MSPDQEEPVPTYATADRVGREELLAFVRPRHRATLSTRRADGTPQMSPVTCGVDADGRIVVSTYPQRAKAVNARRDRHVSPVVHSDDWDEYRDAMRRQGKSLIRVTIDRWGPIATGGFPPETR